VGYRIEYSIGPFGVGFFTTITPYGTFPTTPALVQSQSQTPLDRALRYVDKIKQRCDTKTYRQFFDILRTSKRGTIDKVRLFRLPALSYSFANLFVILLPLGRSHQAGQSVIQRRTRAPCQFRLLLQ